VNIYGRLKAVNLVDLDRSVTWVIVTNMRSRIAFPLAEGVEDDSKPPALLQ